nr:MAG TPA: hypothetical protein [Bacteriophage sp.]DAW42469.1 MAG TPA: hypothetical protein [Bacteriophage sp.]
MQGEFLVAILSKPVYTIYIVQHKHKKKGRKGHEKEICSCTV